MNVRTRLINALTAQVLMVSFLLGGTGALVVGLQDSLKAVEDTLRRELKVVAVLQATVSDAEAERWTSTLMSIDPDILSVDLTSRAQAITHAQGNPLLAKSLQLLPQNPFPASVELRYQDWAWLGRSEPAAALKGQTPIQSLKWDPEARSIFRSIHQWRAWLIRFSAFGFLMLLVWSFFGVYRFLELKASMADVLIQLGLGVIGGSLALLVWGLSLRQIGADAALYRPETVTLWPLVTAAMSALATFGWKVHNRHDA